MMEALGWSPEFEEAFSRLSQPGTVPCRVVRQDRDLYLVRGEGGDLPAGLSGRFRFDARDTADLPVVGDWVAVRASPAPGRGVICALIPRRTRLSRKAPGTRTTEQVLAANLDVAFLVAGLDGGRNFSPRRIERLLTLAYDGGVSPVVVLNKADLCDEVDVAVLRAEAAAPGVPVRVVSAFTGQGVGVLPDHLGPGRTGAFLGPSGVGKSTLLNALCGTERQETRAVREGDLRGRHTTTARELFLLPGRGVLIDTPGLREVQLWTGGDGEASSFADVEAAARRCRFRDCRHGGEPGCAVQAALGEGELDPERYESYLEQSRELDYLKGRKAYLERKKERFKKIAKWSRKQKKKKKGAGRG
jgi:ribosome biogenesis GTPase